MKKTVISLLFLAMSLCLYARGLRVVFIGDSITDGNWGVVYNYKPTSAQRSQTDMNHIYGHGYVNAVASYYEAKYPSREFSFFNRGFSGHSLSDLESRWQEDVLDLHPDILSVLIGTNDIHAALPDTDSFDFEGWKARYKALLERVRERNPSVKLVLCTPFVAKVGKVGDSADYARREEAVAHLASIIRELAEECHCRAFRHAVFQAREKGSGHLPLDLGRHSSHSGRPLQDGGTLAEESAPALILR